MGLTVGLPQCDSPFFFVAERKGTKTFASLANVVLLFWGENSYFTFFPNSYIFAKYNRKTKTRNRKI